MKSKNIFLLALVLVLSLPIIRTSAQPQENETLMTRPGCPYRCEGNNIRIPHPFGIGPNCYRNELFAIDCNNSSGTLTPYVNGTLLEVLEITTNNGQLRVRNPQVASLGIVFNAVSAVLEWSTYGNCSTGNFTCGDNALCAQVTKSDIGCYCPDGFEGNPYVRCQDFDECAHNSTNRCNMGCENFPRGYRCLCDLGYELLNNSSYTCGYINNGTNYIIDPPKTKPKAIIIGAKKMSTRGRGRGNGGRGGRVPPLSDDEYTKYLSLYNSPGPSQKKPPMTKDEYALYIHNARTSLKPFDICEPEAKPKPLKEGMISFASSSSQLVPTTIDNRFTVLGQIPKQYNQMLTSQPKADSPFDIEPVPKPILTSNFQKSSPYLPKYQINLFPVEPTMSDQNDPLMLALSYFPPNWHYLPQASHKSLKFYNKILVTMTESIQIKPIYDRVDKSKVIYHSLYIKKIMSLEEWGANPYDLYPLSGTEHFYSYHDYVEAWMKILCYQNETFSHSWFIQFDSKFKWSFPNWFIRWWEMFGPDQSYLPETLIDHMNYFGRVYPFKPNDPFSKIPLIILFLSKFKIPWILKWQYNLSPSNLGQFNIVTRQIFVKWWDKYTIERTTDVLLNEFPLVQNPIVPAKVTISNKPTMPSSSTSKLVIPEVSPNKTTPFTIKDTFDVNQLSYEQLKELFAKAHESLNNAQLISQRIEEAHIESPKSSNEGSITGPAQTKNWYEMSLYEDAQDPYK